MVVATPPARLSQQWGMAAQAAHPKNFRMWNPFQLLGAAALALQASLSGDAGAVITIDPRDPFFERQSRLKVGAKGEDAIDVSAVDDGCFHHAEIVWLDRRFAEAQFVQIPEQACVECDALIVRWYHEPTGKLHFRVKVYRTACPLQPTP